MALDTIIGLSVIFATLFGPVLAVLVSSRIDKTRQKKERQLYVFRALMGSRRAPISQERVHALNLVEIEFYGVQSVEKAYKFLMEHINVRPLDQTWDSEFRKRMTKLLSTIAKELGYQLEQLDVLDGGYYPQGFSDEQDELRTARRLLNDVLSGHRSLLVSSVPPMPSFPFPPPPPP